MFILVLDDEHVGYISVSEIVKTFRIGILPSNGHDALHVQTRDGNVYAVNHGEFLNTQYERLSVTSIDGSRFCIRRIEILEFRKIPNRDGFMVKYGSPDKNGEYSIAFTTNNAMPFR